MEITIGEGSSEACHPSRHVAWWETALSPSSFFCCRTWWIPIGSSTTVERDMCSSSNARAGTEHSSITIRMGRLTRRPCFRQQQPVLKSLCQWIVLHSLSNLSQHGPLKSAWKPQTVLHSLLAKSRRPWLFLPLRTITSGKKVLGPLRLTSPAMWRFPGRAGFGTSPRTGRLFAAASRRCTSSWMAIHLKVWPSFVGPTTHMFRSAYRRNDTCSRGSTGAQTSCS